MGKMRDLFKKIRDTKGTFHAKMGSIKDRNGMAPSPSPCSAFSGFFPFSFFYLIYCIIWASLVTQTVKNLPAMQET